MSADKCPHCGSPVQSTRDGFKSFTCGAYVGKVADTQPTLCYERAAHAATKRELEAAKANASMWHQRYEVQKQAHELSELAAKKAETELEATKRELEEVRTSLELHKSELRIANARILTSEARVAELEEYRKERQDFIDRDNAMKMAAEDDAAKFRKAESRVAELEGLSSQVVKAWKAFDLSEGDWERTDSERALSNSVETIGQAMPGGER